MKEAVDKDRIAQGMKKALTRGSQADVAVVELVLY